MKKLHFLMQKANKGISFFSKVICLAMLIALADVSVSANNNDGAEGSILATSLLGDANEDGSVNIADVQCSVMFMLNGNPQPFNFENADVNTDGNINILDLQRIIVIITQGGGNTVTDIDGNTYRTVTIGQQVWMAENLRTTTYNDGEAIPNVTGDSQWTTLGTGAYCWYNNDAEQYKEVYGALYNWYVVSTGKLCPTGWHVPSADEWQELSNFAGGDGEAGAKLKESGFEHWNEHENGGSTDEYQFTGLPGGHRMFVNGMFFDLGSYGNWWTSTGSDLGGCFRDLRYANPYVGMGYFDKKNGFSVRCVQD